MFPSAKQNHADAIPPRVAECETIQESLYKRYAQSDCAQHYLPQQMSHQEATDAVAELFR